MNTWIEISESNFQHNLQTLKSLLNYRTRLSLVLKANAYGHGLDLMTKLTRKYKITHICVCEVAEAKTIHSLYPTVTILIMLPQNTKTVDWKPSMNQYLIFASCIKDEIKLLNSMQPRPKIHLKINTGMGRLGFKSVESKTIIQELFTEKIRFDGLMTHFAKSDIPKEQNHTQEQIQRFSEILKFTKKYQPNIQAHCCASAGTLHFQQAHLDMVRIGVSIYGFFPSEESKFYFKNKLQLKPILSWKTKLIHIQTLEKGDTVSYGATFEANKKMKIGIVPIGYYDGLDRLLSNQGEMLIKGKKCKILGRVCMNLTVLDLSKIEQEKINDTVIVIGKDGKEEITTDEIAKKCRTINYEIVTRINPLIKRILMD